MVTTTRMLARRLKVEVSTNGTSGWTAVSGTVQNVPDIRPVPTQTVVYGGRSRTRVREVAWQLVMTYTQLVTGTTRDAGQALLEACVAQLNDAATIYIRWFDRNHLAEAFSGRAVVDIQRATTGVADLSQVTVTFTGDGAVTAIANPYP